jgi:hypothetical protein
VYELGHLVASESGGNLEHAYAALRETIRECLDAGMDNALHLSLKHAFEANDQKASSTIEETIEDEAQSSLFDTFSDNKSTAGSMFAIPLLIYSDRPFLARSIPESEHLDSLVKSFRSLGLVEESASVHIVNDLYTADELWTLTWSQVRSLPSKIADAKGKGMSAPLTGLCLPGDARLMAFPGDNSNLNLRYMLGVIARPAEEEILVKTRSGVGLESLDDRKMDLWTAAAREHLERTLHARGTDILVDVLEPHPFYEATRQGVNGYNILSFMLQFDDLLQANHAEPKDVAAIIALYDDDDQNLTARASVYTYTDEQVIGGCSYEIYPFEDANEAILTVGVYLTEQGVVDVSFVTKVLPDSICQECGEPRLIGPHPGDGKDPTLGFVHRHQPPIH